MASQCWPPQADLFGESAMPQLSRKLQVVVLALGSLVAAGGLAVAQSAPPSPGPAGNGGPPTTPQPQSGPETATRNATPEDSSVSVPVFAITSVEVLRSAHTQGLDIIA